MCGQRRRPLPHSGLTSKSPACGVKQWATLAGGLVQNSDIFWSSLAYPVFTTCIWLSFRGLWSQEGKGDSKLRPSAAGASHPIGTTTKQGILSGTSPSFTRPVRRAGRASSSPLLLMAPIELLTALLYQVVDVTWKRQTWFARVIDQRSAPVLLRGFLETERPNICLRNCEKER